jgi:membrane dipeptidase
MLIVDAHEDIAWNMRDLQRDYGHSALWIREQEAGGTIPQHTGSALLGKPEWLLGHVGVIFATLFAAPADSPYAIGVGSTYTTAREAHDHMRAQLDIYHRLADEDGQFRLVGSQADLDEVLATWGDDKTLADRRIGLVPLMEGAEAVLEPEQVEEWYEWGLRIVGLAWEKTRYAGGTHTPGPLTSEGFHLLEVMADLNMILDLSHLAEEAYYQAVERYEGVLIASHSNPRRFVSSPRNLSDDMIGRLAERDGVMGIVPYNLFLKEGWRKGNAKDAVSLMDAVDAVDHVCQVTGSARYVGIGSDFDGGLGVEHVPAGIDTVADLIKLRDPLVERGFSPEQIDDIFSGNWLRILRRALPSS